MKHFSIIVFLVFVYLIPTTGISQNYKADDILDVWWNEEKDARFEIYKENGKYFAKINWLETPIDPDTGKPKVDDENPDENLQDVPLIGLMFMNDFVYDGDGIWEDGEIYDPKNGSTYDCYMKLLSKDELKVRGYIGFSFIGRTSYWYRYKK